MTTERWNDDRLDRLAETVEANSRDIASLKESIAQTNQNVNQLVGAMQLGQNSTDELFQANTRVLQLIVEEIRGLRAENRRILTHLFGEQSE